MSLPLEVLKINYKDWLLSAYKYYVTFEDTLFDDFSWDNMYYEYMQNIESFPFLKSVGINVIITEESYTSKVDHFAGEEMCKHDKYLGKRVKRGLFKSSTGKILNSDETGVS